MEVMMNSQEDIINEIEKIMSEEHPEYEVRIQDACKQGKTGKMVIFKTPDMTSAPSVHLSDFENMDMNADEIAREIIKLVLKAEVVNPDLEFVFDYKNAKDKLYITMVNARFADYLRDKVYHETEFENLVMLPKIKIDMPGQMEGSIAINEAIISHWDVDKETVFEDALLNSQKIMPFIESPLTAGMPPILPFRVFTNEIQIDGSNIMMYPAFRRYLDESYEAGAFILPSSRHEILIIDFNTVDMTKPNATQSLLDVVASVNRTEIPPEDFLADNVYFYSNGKVESYS